MRQLTRLAPLALAASTAIAALAIGASACSPSRSSPSASRRDAAAPAGSARAAGSAQPITQEDYDKHVAALRRRVGKEFTIRVEPPFVVIGDGDPEAVDRHVERTVRWATTRLKKDYFERDPTRILDVWLFKDATSYESNTKRLYNERPTTPYGYYSSRHDALFMNIATGGGTLVHEIVHPFVEADFPGCPAWLNEGLGSLYEQCGDEDGHIEGYPNWRLPALQKAIREGRVPSFEALTSTNEYSFYEEDPGTNYAQARYLCYYLQMRGLLVRYYHELRAGHAEDPTGYATLKRVLGETDMDAWKRRWETFVLALRYPERER